MKELRLTIREKFFLIFAIIWPLLLLVLGSWWVYLFFLLGEQLDHIELKNGMIQVNLSALVRFEGPVFLGLLVSSTLTLFALYWRDFKHHRSWQLFFASLSHELKTPLASIQLQAEVMREKLLEKNMGPDILKFSDRLLEDAKRLEHEFDQVLQLSQIERGIKLPLESIDLLSFVKRFLQTYHKKIDFELSGTNLSVLANSLALKLIFTNLIENTLRHRQSKDQQKIRIEVHENRNAQQVHVHYSDHGPVFSGDLTKLGQAFYKFNTGKGTGLGLYIIKKLMIQMMGQAQFRNKENRFEVVMQFPNDRHIERTEK